MGFSKEWDERYLQNTHMSTWPWSDLVSLVMRHLRPDGRPLRILEIGCGAGANIPFLLSLPGAEYWGIEGSPTMVEALKARHVAAAPRLFCADFTKQIPCPGPFDAIAVRSSLTHNSTEDIKRGLHLIKEVLKPGGLYFGVDWFSMEHGDASRGKPTEDPYTRMGYESGQMSCVGKVHFSDEKHLRDLFTGFEFLSLEHKTVDRIVGGEQRIGAWNFVVKKL